MRENDYQAQLIQRLRVMFPGCFIMKNDTAYMQGLPDLTIFYGPRWAWLEVKTSRDAPEQPNQAYYVELAQELSFGAFIFPENEEDVLYALQQAFKPRRATRLPKS